MLRVFLVVFSLRKLYTDSYVRLSLLLAKPPTQENCTTPAKNNILTPKNCRTLTREALHFFVEFMICVCSLRQTLLFSEV
jgi:hypothetical protein